MPCNQHIIFHDYFSLLKGNVFVGDTAKHELV